MRDIGPRIRERRQKLSWSIQKLATLAELDRGFLSKLETGRATGSWETYTKIAGALGISVEKLFLSTSNVEPAPMDWRAIPVLSYRQASEWSVRSRADDLAEPETIMTALEHSPSTFALRLRDDTNAPQYQAGDVAVVDPAIEPAFGDMVIASDGQGTSLFAQYRDGGINERGERVFELHPLNPIYAPKRSDRQTLALVGTMVEHRSYRRRG